MKSINLILGCVLSLVLFGCTKGCSSDNSEVNKVIDSESSEGESMDSLEESIGGSEESPDDSPINEDEFIDDTVSEIGADEEGVLDMQKEEYDENFEEDDYSEEDPE